jgi:Transcription factor WhiB
MSTPFPSRVHTQQADRASAGREEPTALSDLELTARLMSPLARCAMSDMDPDAWFPVAKKPHLARREGSRALAVCQQCAVRAECLEVSMRQWEWPGLGRHGIWGGFVEADRTVLHRAWSSGVPVMALLRSRDPARQSHVAEPRTGQQPAPAA